MDACEDRAHGNDRVALRAWSGAARADRQRSQARTELRTDRALDRTRYCRALREPAGDAQAVSDADVAPALATLFTELVDGAARGGDAFVLNSGDVGLLRSLAALSASEASRSVEGGGTIAAHARHVAIGL